ncbi:hypothetical protein LTR99_004244 [Exophiala xenobiotica]|nr:hypothetical protein LTR99_004244 [Exophiala xenobiotica]KAK5435713.1 hypothetical protein LTR34_003217 [Exophiala xenobiotica]KAK5538390.1 hypothetical protein LTR23_007015 [Chaetothyriales sp. CCFEE 6169]
MAARQLAIWRSGTEPAFDIIAIDVNPARLELAKELGASHVINSQKQVTRDVIMQVTNNNGVDAAVDCTGVLPVINEMIELVGVGGNAVTVGGPPPGTKASIDVFDMLIKCKTYSGCHQGNAYSKSVPLVLTLTKMKFIPWLADLYTKGHFPLEKLQKMYKAQDVNQACQDMEEGKVLKPILLWD